MLTMSDLHIVAFALLAVIALGGLLALCARLAR
jgi:hypothetical protein